MPLLHDNALACLDQAPQQALILARHAYQLAQTQNDTRVQTESALTLAIVLNRLGEFREALPLCETAATQFSACGDHEHAARALCELAWAYVFIGDREQTLALIERARASTSSPLIHTRGDWIQAHTLRDQSFYLEAIALFEKARDTFQAHALPLDAARCERELAHTYILCEQGDAVPLLEQLQSRFEAENATLDAAFCLPLRGSAAWAAGRYTQAKELFIAAQRQFADLQVGFFHATCNMELGMACDRLNHFAEALQVLQQARDYFIAHDLHGHLSACTINLANVYYRLNRYDEALALYQQVAQSALAEGREARVARIYTNIGLVYAKQGRFAQALDLHYRALQIADAKGLTSVAAGNHAQLAACHRQLGQSAEALAHLQARMNLTGPATGDRFVSQQIDLAHLYLVQGQFAKAVTCLKRARHVAVTDQFDSYIALCDRLLAQATAARGDRKRALARIENARLLFAKHSQIVDGALCDLTEGEMRLMWNEFAEAREFFQRARAVLAPGFPDQVWRADYGLGRCAMATGDQVVALDHYLSAVRTIASSRAILVTEQISNDFFAPRQAVFDQALACALAQNAMHAALEIIEASKARTFLSLLQPREWKLREHRDDARVADLIAREKDLRYKLDELRQHIVVQTTPRNGESLRGRDLQSAAATELEEWTALNQMYEDVVSQLRLATAGLAGVSEPAPFDLERFRAAANSSFDSDWTALDYYLTEDRLTIVMIFPDAVRSEQRKLSAYDRAILAQCASAEPDQRELVYRGTLHNTAASNSGAKSLQHLHRLLIPEKLGTTLIVSPHGSLHALPFHALVAPNEGNYLIERHTVLYAPNLQAFQVLGSETMKSDIAQVLVLGMSDFGSQMCSLPAAAREVDGVSRMFSARTQSLWGEQATRQRLLAMDASGELQKFDILHFATHAILDQTAPHRSRILLADEALTTVDIFDLNLKARLVTLSACQTALSQGGRGDELIGLARVFFYAGARALLATLWHVEDQATAELSERFYRHLNDTRNAAVALQNAQVEMIRAGYAAHQWASFSLIGRP
ncbi:MAG: CHAT domain-containing protein [Chloroflexi bacterium]|nr:CHAT domain-containing protein [Chloroflexota bacterium]